MEIEFTLRRAYLGEKYTIGHFGLTGQPEMCDTIEDKVRKEKISGVTAIPFGRYQVTIEMSPRFKRRLPYLHDVPKFTGILIHRGNTAEDSRGCILPGENTEKGKVLNSTYWEIKITNMIDNFIKEGHEVYINII